MRQYCLKSFVIDTSGAVQVANNLGFTSIHHLLPPIPPPRRPWSLNLLPLPWLLRFEISMPERYRCMNPCCLNLFRPPESPHPATHPSSLSRPSLSRCTLPTCCIVSHAGVAVGRNGLFRADPDKRGQAIALRSLHADVSVHRLLVPEDRRARPARPYRQSECKDAGG